MLSFFIIMERYCIDIDVYFTGVIILVGTLDEIYEEAEKYTEDNQLKERFKEQLGNACGLTSRGCVVDNKYLICLELDNISAKDRDLGGVLVHEFYHLVENILTTRGISTSGEPGAHLIGYLYEQAEKLGVMKKKNN